MRLTSDQRERIVRIIRAEAGDDAALVAVWFPHARLGGELLLPVDISFIDRRQGMTRFQKLAAAQALPVEAVQ